MSSDPIDVLVEQLESSCLVRPEELQGCSEDEIISLESALKCRLPAVYRRFLERMGKSAGRFFQGEDAFYGDLVEIQTAAREVLAKYSDLVLPAGAFVFLMHQ